MQYLFFKQALGQIALKLKPEIEARAQANMAAGGGDHKSEHVKSGLVSSPNPILPVDTRKEVALAVGIGEQTMGRVAQLAETAPQALKDTLDRKEVSINRGWKILKAVQHLPPGEQESAAEVLSAVREIDQLDAEAERRGKIAGLFCKTYEKAVLLTPMLENVRCWVENTRMRPDEIEDSVRESYELAQTFQIIGDMLKNVILCECQQTMHSDKDWAMAEDKVLCIDTLSSSVSLSCQSEGAIHDTLIAKQSCPPNHLDIAGAGQYNVGYPITGGAPDRSKIIL